MAGRNGRTVRDLRRANRTAVLQRLYFDGPLSRLELGPATGLSSGSVSNVVAELVADGLLEEAGSVDSDGGRPRTLLRVAPGSGHMIGVDVGETRVRVELFDLTLTELARANARWPPSGYEVEVDRRPYPRRHRRGAGRRRRRPRAAARRRRRRPRHRRARRRTAAPSCTARPSAGTPSRWRRCSARPPPLPDAVPYFIDNGAKTLGQAEMWFGGGRGAQQRRRRPLRLRRRRLPRHRRRGGAAAGPVEWGHLTVRVRGRRCRCGALGCLEAYAGAEALLDRWREAGGRRPDGADEETALTAMLAAAYPTGDGAAADPVAPGRPGGDRRVPGRRALRPDQPLPARAHPDRRLGRACQLGPASCPPYAGTPPRTPCATPPGRSPSSWAGSAPTRSRSAPRSCRSPTSSPAAAGGPVRHRGPLPAWRTALQERAPH